MAGTDPFVGFDFRGPIPGQQNLMTAVRMPHMVPPSTMLHQNRKQQRRLDTTETRLRAIHVIVAVFAAVTVVRCGLTVYPPCVRFIAVRTPHTIYGKPRATPAGSCVPHITRVCGGVYACCHAVSFFVFDQSVLCLTYSLFQFTLQASTTLYCKRKSYSNDRAGQARCEKECTPIAVGNATAVHGCTAIEEWSLQTFYGYAAFLALDTAHNIIHAFGKLHGSVFVTLCVRALPMKHGRRDLAPTDPMHLFFLPSKHASPATTFALIATVVPPFQATSGCSAPSGRTKQVGPRTCLNLWHGYQVGATPPSLPCHLHGIVPLHAQNDGMAHLDSRLHTLLR